VPGPSALPSVGARVAAFAAIVVGGFCGLLIGRSLVRLQCDGRCDLALGLGALAGGVLTAVGVAVVVVLVMRAMGDWRATGGTAAPSTPAPRR